MKNGKRLLAAFLSIIMLFQLVGCKSEDDEKKDDKKISGATVFQALKNEVQFDSDLTEVEKPEDLFEDLPEGSDVTLMTGPGEFSDQLGMIQVEKEEDLDDAEQSVNNYLQDMYDSAYAEDPETAEKFENVAVWKYEVYIVFCITINYTQATQIIDDTVTGEKPQPPVQPEPPENKPAEPEDTEPEPTVPEVIEPEETERWLAGPTNGRVILEREGNIIRAFAYDGEDKLAWEGAYECTVVTDNNYTYYCLDVSVAEVVLVVINDEIIAVVDMLWSEDEESLDVPFDFEWRQYIDAWAFKEGSDDPTPTNLNWAMYYEFAEEYFAPVAAHSPFSHKYYAQSKLLYIYNEFGAVTFYVEDDGSLTYVEGISLVQQTQYPDAIQTGANYVIVDTK